MTTSPTTLRWPTAITPLRMGPFSGRIEVRSVVWTTVVVVAAIGLALLSLTIGNSTLSVEAALQWRLPRVAFAMLGGACLAIGGAVFQSITRNPLGSPDIIGFSTGAYTGALLVTLFAAGSALATSIAALAGGILTGVVVYALAYRRGVTGMRIIVVGIGVSLFLGAFNTWMLTTLRLEEAISAASWGAGSLLDITWSHVVPVAIALVVVLPVVLALSGDMRMLEMGDDAGRSLGVRAEVVRVTLLLLGIALVAIVTAAAGPIAFVALSAPQLAMRLTGTPGARIVPAAAVGALLLLASDLIARTLLPTQQLPVGVVTLCLGGAYLVWLLAAHGRKGTA